MAEVIYFMRNCSQNGHNALFFLVLNITVTDGMIDNSKVNLERFIQNCSLKNCMVVTVCSKYIENPLTIKNNCHILSPKKGEDMKTSSSSSDSDKKSEKSFSLKFTKFWLKNNLDYPLGAGKK
jgi:hypothetical protein